MSRTYTIIVAVLLAACIAALILGGSDSHDHYEGDGHAHRIVEWVE